MSTDENKLENGVSTHAQGYDALGTLMGACPETAIFRQFAALSAQDLLHRQAELAELQEALAFYQREDMESGHEDREAYSLSWHKLKRSGDDDAPEGNDSAQLEKLLMVMER